MKKQVKGYLIGFLTAAIIFSSVAYAANTTTLYNVLTRGIQIVIDGQRLYPTDVNGNPVEPMIYNGTTYLPVRAVANALGKSVYWDGDNLTVYLGEMSEPVYLLQECEPYLKTGRYEEYLNGELFTVGGTEVTNGFQTSASEGTVIFNLEGKYHYLEFLVGHIPDTNLDDAKIKIYLDGNLAKTVEMSYEDLAKKVAMDLTDVKQLKFVVEGQGSQGTSWVSYGFGNILIK